eukprot:TRINITY_DN66476_c12_g1_i1.p1 TRINITY_DN66476_c12_g1~~TRINITY_DN66476_c12_g1_i1.p1  ORF type:complete len:233 (-),score=19.48 TRINITY_DN66476_c12_g1_i1:182-805(-)
MRTDKATSALWNAIWRQNKANPIFLDYDQKNIHFREKDVQFDNVFQVYNCFELALANSEKTQPDVLDFLLIIYVGEDPTTLSFQYCDFENGGFKDWERSPLDWNPTEPKEIHVVLVPMTNNMQPPPQRTDFVMFTVKLSYTLLCSTFDLRPKFWRATRDKILCGTKKVEPARKRRRTGTTEQQARKQKDPRLGFSCGFPGHSGFPLE